MKIPNAVILAAGRGSRMKPLTDRTPKALLPSPHNSLLSRQIAFFEKYVENIVVTNGYLGHQIAQRQRELNIDLLIDTNGHGNAFFIGKLFDLGISGRVPVITCDNIMDVNLERILEEDTNFDSAITIVTITNQTGLLGDRIKTNSDLVVEEIGPTVSSPILASGLQVIDVDVCKQFSAENFDKLWQELIRSSLLRVSSVHPHSWNAFDDVESLSKLRS